MFYIIMILFVLFLIVDTVVYFKRNGTEEFKNKISKKEE